MNTNGQDGRGETVLASVARSDLINSMKRSLRQGGTQGGRRVDFNTIVEHDSDDDAPSEGHLSASYYREALQTECERIVVVGKVQEGCVFACDEAVSVVRRIAAAAVQQKGFSSFKALAPIRRNVTSFCMTTVQAIAISPVALILFVGHDHLASFLRSFGPARSPGALDKQLRQQREWQRYKRELAAAAVNRPSTHLQQIIGPRIGQNRNSFRSTNGALPQLGNAGAGGTGTRRTASLHDNESGGNLLVDALASAVNGAAAAELAAASSETGTTVIESFSERCFLQPVIKSIIRPHSRAMP